MNLRNKSHFLVIFSILIYEVKSVKVCCPNNGTIMSAWKCKDGSAVKVTCDRSLYNIINPDNGFRNHFIINHDDRGEYLDVYLLEYSIYEPDFCLGPYYASFLNRNTTVAVVCLSQRVWYSNQNRTGVAEAIGEVTFLKIYDLLTFIFNLLSGLAFLITAGIYFFLPDVQDLQGTCYFHLTLTAALGHLTFTYIELFDTQGLLPDMCITNAYLTMYLVLSAFSWLSVSSFNIRRQIRNLHNDNEEKLKQHYQLVAYGVPAFLVLFTFLHVHILDRDEDFSFVLSCLQHQNRILNTYVQFPILLSLLLNILMFLNSQINICNLHTIQLSDKKLMGKIVKYRIFMNVKLFFTTGIPWSFMIIVSLLGSMIGNNIFFSYLSMFAEFLILGEGIPIFLILVLFRKRVLRGVANRWLTNTPLAVDKWKTVHDSETEEDNENEEERRADNGHHNFEVRFDKTNNINHENLNNHDSPPIVIF